MSTVAVYAATVELETEAHIARWRPLVQWLLVISHLAITHVLNTLRCILTLVSLVTVLFTRRIPRSVFDAIAMTYRYEWRAVGYALFLHDDYPPFDFTPASDDDGRQPSGQLAIQYPEQLKRWKPLYKWLLAAPHYVVCLALAAASAGHRAGGSGRRPCYRPLPRAPSPLPGLGVSLRDPGAGVRRPPHRPLPPLPPGRLIGCVQVEGDIHGGSRRRPARVKSISALSCRPGPPGGVWSRTA